MYWNVMLSQDVEELNYQLTCGGSIRVHDGKDIAGRQDKALAWQHLGEENNRNTLRKLTESGPA